MTSLLTKKPLVQVTTIKKKMLAQIPSVKGPSSVYWSIEKGLKDGSIVPEGWIDADQLDMGRDRRFFLIVYKTQPVLYPVPLDWIIIEGQGVTSLSKELTPTQCLDLPKLFVD